MTKYRSRLLIDTKNVISEIIRDVKRYTGFVYEDIAKEYLIKKYPEYNWGREWGKYTQEGEKKIYEIDLMGISLKKDETLFVEVKWKDDVNTEKILSELREKATYVNWKKQNRKDKFIIVARSFKVKTDEYECIDLQDLKKYFKSEYV